MRFQKRGLVTSIKDDYCIVLNPDGGYEKIPLPSPQVQVGEEVFYNRVRIPTRLKSVLLAASFLLFILTSVLVYQSNLNRVAAYITMDINPSLEISVDSKSLVLDVTCLNEEATRLVKPGEYKGKGLDYTIADIIEKSVEQEFLKPGEENLIVTTISMVDEKAEPVNGEALSQLVEQSAVARDCQVQVRVYNTSGEVRKKARNSGVSSGKYLIYEEVRKQDPSIKIDDVKKDSLRKLLEKHKVELPPNFESFTYEKGQIGRNNNVGGVDRTPGNNGKKNNKNEGKKSSPGDRDKTDNSKNKWKKQTNRSNKANEDSKQWGNKVDERRNQKTIKSKNQSSNHWQTRFFTKRSNNGRD
ncbi:MAG: anti-sigma factor domain-containing protein [Syntrophomonadaceae bacterium]|nr:anti-sigma factor domain-containing protein [Syntrophomonadaceae bacterium]